MYYKITETNLKIWTNAWIMTQTHAAVMQNAQTITEVISVIAMMVSLAMEPIVMVRFNGCDCIGLQFFLYRLKYTCIK